MQATLPGKTERRLAAVIFFTTVVPLAVAIYLATSMFRQASSLWFNPEIGQQLDRGVDVYKDYVRAVKDDLRHQTMAMAADEPLQEAARKKNVELIESELDVLFPRFHDLVKLDVIDEHSRSLAHRDRGKPVDERTEKSLEVRRPLGDDEAGPTLVATFAVPRKRLDELEAGGAVVAQYHQLEASRTELYKIYLNAFSLLLASTVLVTVVLGIVLARGVTKRINRLGMAVDLVARGDFAVRVPVTGSDELTQLAKNFNRMIGEMAHSRSRIEYLQRMEAWQEMAQRLAHEIKNPLTPIQLAVQECHRKYTGDDARFQSLLGTTVEIVSEEIGTLRRLVSNFSNFARLPHAELEQHDLREFLRECSEQLGHLEDPSLGESSPDAEPLKAHNVQIAWDLPKSALPVAIDKQMLRRVLINLVRNAVQAIRDARPEGHVRVGAVRGDDGTATIYVEDDGPGIPEAKRDRVFDPYFTTKADGTGLGLAIVKKIVVEHGGEIDVEESPLGGARFVLRLPAAASMDGADALQKARARAKESGVEMTTRSG